MKKCNYNMKLNTQYIDRVKLIFTEDEDSILKKYKLEKYLIKLFKKL